MKNQMSRETLTSGAKFVQFGDAQGEVKEFAGTYTGHNPIREKDKGDQKAGEIMGYEFADENGELHIVGNAAAIEKAMTNVKKGDKIYFTWLEKIEMDNGKTFNRFKIERETITQA